MLRFTKDTSLLRSAYFRIDPIGKYFVMPRKFVTLGIFSIVLIAVMNEAQR